MKDALRTKCELLAENRNILGKAFFLESNYILQIASSIYANQNAIADVERIKASIKLIKSKTGIF